MQLAATNWSGNTTRPFLLQRAAGKGTSSHIFQHISSLLGIDHRKPTRVAAKGGSWPDGLSSPKRKHKIHGGHVSKHQKCSKTFAADHATHGILNA
eukprot:2636971-Amphidinium_carterae.1